MEHVDVLVVGAGLSGIGAAHHLQTKCPWASYVIFEARDAIGGTWDLFRYPGIRSDSDMYTLGYSFRPWRSDEAIADGSAILQYIRDTAAEAGIDRHIRFGHRVVRLEWDTGEARWHVTAEAAGSGDGANQTVELTCDFVFSCTGYYRYDHGHLPDFPGMDDYAGTLVHPQAWPEDLDYAGKRIVVIGSGATAVTLIPQLARDAAHVTMLQRSPSYIVSPPRRGGLPRLLSRVLPQARADAATRWVYALGTQAIYRLSKRRPETVKRMVRRNVERQLPAGYDVDTHFTPHYDPWDQRLCLAPDGDLFAAIREGRASVVTDHVDTFTEKAIRLESGDELEADIVITATGLDLLFLGGMSLVVDGEEVDLAERLTYKGMMLEGVPNLAVAIGYTNASWTLKCELTCDYVCRLLDHMRQAGLRQCTPRNADSEVSAAATPVLGLMSGYVLRSAHLFPKQGPRFPWQVYQSYLRDYRAMKLSKVDDGAMVFSNPSSPSNPASGAPPRTGRRSRPMKDFTGRVAAITGAGSGIGRALALQLADEGAHLALCDVDETGLAETVELCEGRSVKVTSARVDVADRSAVFEWADQVVADHGQVNLLVNNAGVALAFTVDAMSVDDLEWLMGVNFYGVAYGTKAFLPHLVASGEGHVVNVSSVFGFIGIPGQSAYNASKFAVRGFTDALRLELKSAGVPVSCTTVHPGGVKTNIVANGRLDPDRFAGFGDGDPGAAFRRTARTTPDEAAAAILAGVRRDKRRVVIGPDARAFDLLGRMPAAFYHWPIIAAGRIANRRLARDDRPARTRRRRGASDVHELDLVDGSGLDGDERTLVTPDGGELLVHVSGPVGGPTVVLAHCWMGSQGTWAPVARRLVAAGCRVVRWDQRGHGRSRAGDMGHTVEALGDDLATVLHQLDLRDAVLVGHSMGGMTVQSYATRHHQDLHDRARSIVLVATAGFHSSRPPRADRTGLVAHPLVDKIMGRPRLGRLAVRRAFGRDAHAHHLDATRVDVLRTPPHVRRELLVSMNELDLREGISRIRVPTTVVLGRRDTLIPPRDGTAMADAIPDAELEVLDGRGHMLPFEVPELIADTILERAGLTPFRGAAGS